MNDNETSMTGALRRAACAGALMLALAGCGFHLQGASPLPDGIDTMDVSYSDAYSVAQPPLVTALRQRLREQGVLGEAGAPAHLAIRHIDNRQRIVSVSPIDGRVAEYALTTEATFDYRVKGADQMSGEHVSVTRNYSFNDTQRLAAEAEQRDLLTHMQQELANLILQRIADHNDRLAANDAG